jgi:hypothetical protein
MRTMYSWLAASSPITVATPATAQKERFIYEK